jgi:hypothetical protein
MSTGLEMQMFKQLPKMEKIKKKKIPGSVSSKAAFSIFTTIGWKMALASTSVAVGLSLGFTLSMR